MIMDTLPVRAVPARARRWLRIQVVGDCTLTRQKTRHSGVRWNDVREGSLDEEGGTYPPG